MPQITVSVPQEKLSKVQEFLQSLGIEQHIHSMFPPKNRQKKGCESNGEPFSWEYYCNELEFE